MQMNGEAVEVYWDIGKPVTFTLGSGGFLIFDQSLDLPFGVRACSVLKLAQVTNPKRTEAVFLLLLRWKESMYQILLLLFPLVLRGVT